MPDHQQQREADAEREEAVHHLAQLAERLRYLERDDEQRDREREYGVAQPLDSRDVVAAPAKPMVTLGERGPQPVVCVLEHGTWRVR